MSNYIDNDKFQSIIQKYHERKKENPNEKIPEEAGKMIILMANKLATRYVFNRLYLQGRNDKRCHSQSYRSF